MGLLEERDSMRFRLVQDGLVVVGVEAKAVDAMHEIGHYHLVYSQDGPCMIEWYTKGRRWKATDTDELSSALEFHARHALTLSKGSEE